VKSSRVGWWRPLPLEGGTRGAAKRWRLVCQAPEQSEAVGEGDGGIGVECMAGEGVGTRARPEGEAPRGACAEGAAWAGRGVAARFARGVG
jgi:hypothetical protein